MKIIYRDEFGVVLAGLRMSGGEYRTWANVATSLSIASMFLGAADETLQNTTGVATGLGKHLMMAGGVSFLALSLLSETRLVRRPLSTKRAPHVENNASSTL